MSQIEDACECDDLRAELAKGRKACTDIIMQCRGQLRAKVAQLAEVEHERDRALATIDEFDTTIDQLDRLREAAADLLSQVELSDQAGRNVVKLAYDEKASIVRQLIDPDAAKEPSDA